MNKLYPNGIYPDCFEPIPINDTIGMSCKNCGHIWTY